MFSKIKNRIENELKDYTHAIINTYSLNKLSPLLFNKIKEFISRDGKRVRPILFCIGYLGFAKKEKKGLYRSALSLELLHDFMLVHDDIIDRSDTRRGKPSMHSLFNKYLEKKKVKFKGEDLSIITGDVMYAMALDAFLAIEENFTRKELALKKLISAAFYTGSGEFIELLFEAKPIEKATKADIYKIYDYKTANYTFASPLSMGAALAGAPKNELDKLIDYGMNLGRAFQIKDDIIGTFGETSQTGKSNLTDINGGKKTILIWYAYRKSGNRGREKIKNVFSGKNSRKKELLEIRNLILESGGLDYAKKEINNLLKKSEGIIKSSGLRKEYREALVNFSRKILSI
ncbi:MAG: polyprenyl synthetase family protein [Candidatus Omnitrophica bacterium]|jgi:geranylgeranyl diphosphate synthase type I|nr:polyprenyl synthetase family protein [Candidatus Omnitrophota bacterium]